MKSETHGLLNSGQTVTHVITTPFKKTPLFGSSNDYFLKDLVSAEDSVILRCGVIGTKPLLLFSIRANKSKATYKQIPTAPLQRHRVGTEQAFQQHTCRSPRLSQSVEKGEDLWCTGDCVVILMPCFAITSSHCISPHPSTHPFIGREEEIQDTEKGNDEARRLWWPERPPEAKAPGYLGSSAHGKFELRIPTHSF